MSKPDVTSVENIIKFDQAINISSKSFEALQRELIAMAANSQSIIKSFLEAKVDINDFSRSLNQVIPQISQIKSLGAKGTGQAIGQSITGGAIGSMAGGVAGSVASMVASEVGGAIKKSFESSMASVRQGLENSIKTGMTAGLEGAANLMKNRQGAASELESELGMSAAFMGQDQIQAVWKQKKMMADIRTQGQFNVQQAISDEGGIGFQESMSQNFQGLLNTISFGALGSNPAQNSAQVYLQQSAQSLHQSAKANEAIYYTRG